MRGLFAVALTVLVLGLPVDPIAQGDRPVLGRWLLMIGGSQDAIPEAPVCLVVEQMPDRVVTTEWRVAVEALTRHLALIPAARDNWLVRGPAIGNPRRAEWRGDVLVTTEIDGPTVVTYSVTEQGLLKVETTSSARRATTTAFYIRDSTRASGNSGVY